MFACCGATFIMLVLHLPFRLVRYFISADRINKSGLHTNKKQRKTYGKNRAPAFFAEFLLNLSALWIASVCVSDYGPVLTPSECLLINVHRHKSHFAMVIIVLSEGLFTPIRQSKTFL